MCLQLPLISNVKIRFTVSDPLFSKHIHKYIATHPQTVSKHNRAFFVFRSCYVYIIFFSGHINVTGLKTLDHIPLCMEHIKKKLQLDTFEMSPAKVDNICASGKIPQHNISMNNIMENAKLSRCFKSIHYDRDGFPGCFLKHSLGTIILFKSQKYVIVGVDTVAKLNTIYTEILLPLTQS